MRTHGYDLYLVLAETPHGTRYWTHTADPDASVSRADRRAVLGPALVGPAGYPDEASAGQALADEAEIDLDDPATWDAAFAAANERYVC